jgi:hypothetical protein
MRRQEVIGLRGSDVELRKDDLVIRCRVKGGDYVARSVEEPLVRKALLDYLQACERLNALSSERPVWTRHDRAGRPGASLTSHTFARVVAEETGSLTETQEALGHKNFGDDQSLRAESGRQARQAQPQDR